MKNKKTATITWIKYYNFGSFLQAYGLQQSIISLGYDNKILSDKGISADKPPIAIRIILKLKSILSLPFTLKNRIENKLIINKSIELYQQFKDKYLLVDEASSNDLSSCNDKYDQFICGSDQIWHPFDNLDPFYYAGFSDKKKIAYAASFGVSEYPSEKKDEFVKLTSSFSHISCREKVGCAIISDLLGKESTYVADPTLLLSGDKWRRISSSPLDFSNDEKYILTYFLTPNKWYIDFSKQYAKKYKIKLISFFLRSDSPEECDETVIAGPSEFIWLIDHADLVFTDSFHGSIFSTLLHTPFVGFRRFESKETGSGQNHRLQDLYNIVGLKERFVIDKNDCSRVEGFKDIDFEEVEHSLESFRNISIEFLLNSLAD